MTTHTAQLDGSSSRDAAAKSGERTWLLVLIWCAVGVAGLLMLPVVCVIVYVLLIDADIRGHEARRMVTVQSMSTISSAVRQYELQYQALPPSLNTLVPRFLETTPVDAWKRPFVYAPTPDDTNPFTLYSTGASGSEMINLNNANATR